MSLRVRFVYVILRRNTGTWHWNNNVCYMQKFKRKEGSALLLKSPLWLKGPVCHNKIQAILNSSSVMLKKPQFALLMSVVITINLWRSLRQRYRSKLLRKAMKNLMMCWRLKYCGEVFCVHEPREATKYICRCYICLSRVSVWAE